MEHIEIYQLSDTLKSLDWRRSKYVSCSQGPPDRNDYTKCCLCQESLKDSLEEYHMLTGYYSIDEESDKIYYYLCRNCRSQCSVCNYK
jgi:hypothetical protein